MRRLGYIQLAIAVILMCASTAIAQNGKINGTVFDLQGKPYPNVTVTLSRTDNGFSKTLTTDPAGKFNLIGLQAGIYTIHLVNQKDQLDYSEQAQIAGSGDTEVTLNLKEIQAQAASNPDVQKKQAEANKAFNEMKLHFTNGLNAMTDATDLRKQLVGGGDKNAIQPKLDADYATAITELTQAEQGVGPKDTKNHSVVFANLGQAYDFSKKYDDAVGAYQKAIEFDPQAALYTNLSTAQANAAVAKTDAAASTQELADANASCDKAIMLDPTVASKCWKNLGIVLSNKGRMQDALAPLQKATAADAKDAQSWFLLGSAYTNLIVPKQEGDKINYDIPPGTVDAYQKAIDANPTGPYAQQAKDALANLQALSGGVSTVEGHASPAPKKKK